MKAAGTEQIAALLSGADMTWSTPRLQALGAGLALAAERSRCGVAGALELPWGALRTEIWPRARGRAGDSGWNDLIAGIVAAVEVLASPEATDEWPTGSEGSPNGSRFAGVADRLEPSLPGLRELARDQRLETLWTRLRGPHVRALLSDGESARVFFAEGQFGAECWPEAETLRRLGLPGGRIAYDRAVSGSSATAARVLRAAAHRHPALAALGVIGATGDVDGRGVLLPVNAVREKVLGFFRTHPDGLCIVPRGSDEALSSLAPDTDERGRRAIGDRLSAAQWGRLWAVGSVQLLLLRLGISWDDGPTCRLFEAARTASSETQDWRGRTRHPVDLVELLLADEGSHWPTPLRRALARPILSPPGIVIGGKPGSGKSMLLRQAWFELSRGSPEVAGPALLAVARKWRGDDPAEAIAASLTGWSGDQVREVLSDPALEGGVTLLVDGPDELPAARRREVLLAVQRWPGLWLIATRSLPEALPKARRMEVQDLGWKAAQALFESERRPDLAGAVVGWSRSKDSIARVLGELARTPLGVSLLALSSDARTRTAQDLLRDGILHLVGRAAAEGRLSDAVRRRFERVGVRSLGAACWPMLRDGRPHLEVEDLALAEESLDLSREDADDLHTCVEAAGFVQPAGPGRWELSHRAFAEYAAALHLRQLGDAGLAEAVGFVGQPGTNEAIVHLAALAEDPSPALRALLGSTRAPLTSIALATRVGHEADKISDDRDLVEIAARRLRFVASFPHQALPADLSDADALFAFVERHRGVARRHAAALVAACPEAVRDWLEDRVAIQPDELPWSQRDLSSAPVDAGLMDARDLARRVAKALALEVPVRGRLRLGLPISTRDLGAVELLAQDPQLGQRATEAWFATAGPEHLLQHLPRLSATREHSGAVLGAVASHGSPTQVREALLRVSALHLDFPVAGRGDDDASHHRLQGLEQLSADEWLGRWDWAWASGMLGGGPAAAEPLYAKLLRDANPVARWRAVVAVGRLPGAGRAGDATPGLPSAEVEELRVSARDSDRRVRVEAIAVLAAAGRTRPEDLRPLLVSLDADERAVGVEALLGAGFTLDAGALLVALASPPPTPPRRRALTASETCVSERGGVARSKAIDRISRLEQPSLLTACFSLLGAGAAGEVAAELLSRSHLSLHDDRGLRGQLAAHANPAARAWLVDKMRWATSDSDLAVIAALSNDPVQEVAQAACAALERATARRSVEPRRAGPATHDLQRDDEPRAAAPPMERVLSAKEALSFPGPGTAAVGGWDPAAVLTLGTFDAAWSWLESHDIGWERFEDQEGSWTEEASDFVIDHTARARSTNWAKAGPVLAHLARLCTVEHRAALISGLGTPRLGFWSEALLHSQARAPDLLAAFRGSAAASVAAADLAIGSPLQAAAASAFVEALREGTWPVEPPDGNPTWFVEPDWMRSFRRVAGLEGLAILLASDPPPAVVEHALRAIEADGLAFKGSIGMSARDRLAAWARTRWADPDPARAGRVLAVLALVGSEADADCWAARMSATELAPSVRVGAVKVVVGCGGGRHVATLRALVLADDGPLPVVVAALEGLATLADAPGAAWLLDRLTDEPPSVRAAFDRREALAAQREVARRSGVGDWAVGANGEDTWETDRLVSSWRRPVSEAVVRAGTEEHGLTLAELLADQDWAIRLAAENGRLGVHALLVLGALRNDPGDRVIPSEVTGGGDEVAGSDVPEQAARVVERIRQVSGDEPVRLAFLEAALRGFGASEADQWLRRLGGPQPADVPRLLARIRASPRDPCALEYLRDAGGGEAELVQVWRDGGATWLWPVEDS